MTKYSIIILLCCVGCCVWDKRGCCDKSKQDIEKENIIAFNWAISMGLEDPKTICNGCVGQIYACSISYATPVGRQVIRVTCYDHNDSCVKSND